MADETWLESIRRQYMPTPQDLAVAGNSALMGVPESAAHLAGVDTSPFQQMKTDSPNAAAAGDIASFGIMPGLKTMAAGGATLLGDAMFGGSAQAAGPTASEQLAAASARRNQVSQELSLQVNGDPARGVKPGRGPNYRELLSEGERLDQHIKQLTPMAEIEARAAAATAGTDAETKRLGAEAAAADAARKKREAETDNKTWQTALTGGAVAIGGIGGLLAGKKLGAAAAARASAPAADFTALAKEIRQANAAEGPLVGTPAGDHLTSLVNSAYDAGGHQAPFQRAQLAPAIPNSEASIGRALNETTGVLPPTKKDWLGDGGRSAQDNMVAADRAAVEAPFQHTPNVYSPKDKKGAEFYAPLVIGAEGAASTGYSRTGDGESGGRDVAGIAGAGSIALALAMATGSKYGKATANVAKVSKLDEAAVSGAKLRIARELAGTRDPATLAKVANDGKPPLSPAVLKAAATANDDMALTRIADKKNAARDAVTLRDASVERKMLGHVAATEKAAAEAATAKADRLKAFQTKTHTAAASAAKSDHKVAISTTLADPKAAKQLDAAVKLGANKAVAHIRENIPALADRPPAQIKKAVAQHRRNLVSKATEDLAMEMKSRMAIRKTPIENFTREAVVPDVMKRHPLLTEAQANDVYNAAIARAKKRGAT